VKESFSDAEKKTLLQVAKEAISYGLARGEAPELPLKSFPATLRENGACFVTLQQNGQLRGCIGSLEARQPLIQDAADNAFNAAFRDPRFDPVGAGELESLEIHLSVLTPQTPIPFTSEKDLIQKLRPGVDGVVLVEGYHRGTFLPVVWEQLPKREDFFRHLKMKAGMPEDYWSPSVKAFRYEAVSIP
jgi:AmmeMemoRadiSam system protein A